MTSTHKGRCFCGAVEIAVTGAPVEMGFCHCGSCRSYTGAPLVAFVLFKAENVKVTKGAEAIGRFQKSEMSERQFCTKCGGHIMTGHPTLGFTDVYAAAIPTVSFKPSVHLNYGETVLPIRDGLPKLKDFPAEVGGSGQAIPE
jgi:hypothetical protein